MSPAAAFDPSPTPAWPAPQRWTASDLAWLSLLTIMAVVLRLVAIEQWSFEAAEASTFRAVTRPLGGPEGLLASPESAYPAGFLVVRWLLEAGWLRGFTEGWLRLPFAFFGAMTVPLLALYARPRFGRGPARLAALLLAVHPAHVASSQCADPVVMALPVALLAGVLRGRGHRVLAWLAVCFTVLWHPVGVLLGPIAVIGGRPFARPSPPLPRWIALVTVVVGAAAVLMLGELVWSALSAPVLTFAALAAFAVRGAVGRTDPLGAALVVLLLIAAVVGCASPAAARSVLQASLPVATLLAGIGACVFHRQVVAVATASWGRLAPWVAAVPTLLLVGQLATGSFLFYTVFEGDRAPWRDARDALVASRQPGRPLLVAAGRGVDVLRVYLRPSHWREAVAGDPHPNLEVLALPSVADGAALLAVLRRPFVQLVLERDELEQLRAAPAAADALAEFTIARHWSQPRRGGARTLYLLQQRSDG